MWYKFSGNPKKVWFGHTLQEHGKHPDRVLDVWVFGYIHSGNMGLNAGGEKADLKAGSFYLLPPGIRHFGTDDKFNDVYWVHFKINARPAEKPENVDFKNIRLPLFGKLPAELPVKPVMEAMSRLSRQGLSSDEMFGTQFKALLYNIGLEAQKNALKQNRGTRTAYEIFSYLEKNIDKNIRASALEAKFGYCYYELNGFFKEHFGTTIKQKVLDMKIKKAFELLTQGEKIAGVAEKLGFNDYYYFLKLFKKIKHITPKQLKKHHSS